MNEEKQALSEFLHYQQFRYCNPAGITFYRIADGSLYVAAGYPGIKETLEISLDFYQQFDHLTQLLSLLHISHPDCLGDVVTEDLYSFYKSELLDIVCTLKGRISREMSFRKLGGMMWASNTRKKLHQVKTHIDKPEDFIACTLRYYNIGGN
jgi:hypothetical protein